MQCKYYKLKQRNPARWERCVVEAYATITIVDKSTWDQTVLPVCEECLHTLDKGKDYDILNKTILEG